MPVLGGVTNSQFDPTFNPNLPGFDPKRLPSGYEFDPLTRLVGRTPTDAGSRVGQFQSGAYNSGPLAGLLAVGGGTGGAGGTGVTGGAGGGTTGARPTVGWPGGGSGSSGGPVPIGSPTMGDGGAGGGAENSATTTQNAAFATAKDQVGQQSRGAANSLNAELASQGLSGSGAQVQGTKDIIAHGAEDLAKTSSDLATKSAENAITTRGQDIGQQEARYSGQIQQRGQDIQAQQAAATL